MAVLQPNRQQRRALILAHSGGACVWCGQRIDRGPCMPTTDHLVPKVKGGPSWIENEVVACRRCNGERGNRSPAEWLEECERRGWEADRTTVVAALRRLAAAIEERGGQRRARPYLASQLRRLG